jgi:hypothetical protein
MTSYISDYLFFMNIPPRCKNFIDSDMADVLKSLYRRYLEVSEAMFQALLKKITLQVRYTIPSRFPISHRLIKALRDVCHDILCTIQVYE